MGEIDEEDDPDLASGEFIFLIDCSYSMYGPRITLAKQALSLFIKSLPINCKFNVISFGSDYKFMYEMSIDYTTKNANDALEKVQKISAVLGGTNIKPPLEKVFEKEPDVNYPRHIFLLTDGEVTNTSEVIQLIYSQNTKNRVHTFGISLEASKDLVVGAAKAGGGTHHLIPDDTCLNGKVIIALQQASVP
jgi:uncharacterized protein with von Willebrand factor type A (vWA) domain